MIDDFEKSKITVKKDVLLFAIKKNRETHRTVFLEAQKGFREVVISELEKRLAAAREGKRPNIRFSFSEPTDHTADYDRVIKMLEMSTADEILLGERQFAMYVQDDWGWKRDFVKKMSDYTVSAVQNYGDPGEDD